MLYSANILYILQEQRLCGEASVLIQALLAVTEGLLCSSLEGDRWAKFYKSSFQNEFFQNFV